LVEKLQLPTSFHSNQARIKFSTGQCVKEVLCDIARTNSCHLVLRWAWFHFKRSILMNVPFIWGMRDMKWSWNLWHQDKPRRIHIRWRRKQKKKELNKKKYKLQKERKLRKNKGIKETDYGKGSREQCV